MIYNDISDPLLPGAIQTSNFNLLTNSTISGLTSNKTYQFKVEAENIYGTGPLSSALSIHTSVTPDGVAKPTLSYAL